MADPQPRRTAPKALIAVLAIGAVIAGIYAAAGQLPSGTDTSSLILRAVVGLVVGALFVAVIRRMVGSLVEPPPAPPPVVDAVAVEIVYTCGVCGTRVRLETASTGKAPKHCGEVMESTVTPER